MIKLRERFNRESIRSGLFQSVDLSILTLLRIIVGISLYFWACSYAKTVPYVFPDGTTEFVPLFKPVFQDPQFLFKYAGFEWVKLYPGDGIYWHFLATKIAAICLTVGLLTRVSAAVLCYSVTYVLLVERQIYLNHYYLLACAAGLLVFLPAARSLSFDAALGIEKKQTTCPRWQIWLVRFQLGMPYVFGAIAKLDSDWLQGQPAAIYLSRKDFWLVEMFSKIPGYAQIFAFGGFLLDLLIVPLLLYRPTRWIAVAMAVGFHVSNSFLFTIGVFPWLMLATLIVFFPIDTIANLLRCVRGKFSDTPLTYKQSAAIGLENQKQIDGELGLPLAIVSKLGVGLAVLYVAIQLLLPIRPWIVPGNPSWNERGQRFAWRMMLRQKTTMAHYLLLSPDGAFQFYPATVVMTEFQARRAERNPELLRQAAWQFKRGAEKMGIDDIQVFCLSLVSLNGRKPVPLIDPSRDLLTVQRGWWSDDWVNQDIGPLPKKAWKASKDEWWQLLELPAPFESLQGKRPSDLQRMVDAMRERNQ